jgi:phosphohistidine phosphatase
MNLLLVQHAQAKSKEMDPERPLTEKGMQDIRRVAGFLEMSSDLNIANIFHSGKTRARQTAEALGDFLKPQEGIHEVEGLNPLADPAIWAQRLAAEAADLALVGHLPHMSRTASLLLAGDPQKEIIAFQQGGVVCLTRTSEGTAWSLGWMVTPGILEGFQPV